MTAENRDEIPEAEVCLFGSWARGEARLGSDVELLLFCRSQVEQRRQRRSSVVHQASAEGLRLDG